MLFRQGYYRNEALTRMCHDIPCQCQRLTCHGGKSVPAHSNQGKHGKGRGIKAHDCFVASMCNDCHFEVDNGRQLSEAKRAELWTDAWRSTMAILCASRRIKLPEIGLDEYMRVNGGMVLVEPDRPGIIIALPGTVPDDVWLDFWRTGRARVL